MIELPKLVESGGVYFNVAGSTPEEVLSALIEHVKLPAGVEKEGLLGAVLEREELMSTAIGHGIAIPHPRNPQVPALEDEAIIVAYPRSPVSYRALDKQPVYVLFLILSSSQKTHLQILAQLSFLFNDEGFRTILKDRPGKEELKAAIEAALKG